MKRILIAAVLLASFVTGLDAATLEEKVVEHTMKNGMKLLMVERHTSPTVSAWIRSRRLERCRRELADELFADRPVSAIAARWGFLDASHFSRLFRSTFGEAPTDFRKRFSSDDPEITFVAA